MSTTKLSEIEKQAGVPLWMLKLVQDGTPEVKEIASTKEGFSLVYNRITRSERYFILQQLITMITTLKEAKLLCLESRKYGEKLMGTALRKWNVLGEEAVKNATTFSEVASVLKNLPPHSHSAQKAVRKCYDLTRSFQDALFVYNNSTADPTLCRAALKAMIGFSETMLEAKEAYSRCLLGDVLQIRAMHKWNKLGREALTQATTLKEIRVIIRKIPVDGETMEFAAKRALEIAG